MRRVDEVASILDRRFVQHFPGRRLGSIEKREIQVVIDEIAETLPIAANRALAWIRRFYGWAIERDLVTINPAAGIKRLHEAERERELSEAELAALWQACDAIAWPHGPAVKLLMLTGARRDEVGDATWREINLDKATWTLPAERSKNFREHRIHLSPLAVETIAGCYRIENQDDLVFSRGRGNALRWSECKRRLDAEMRAIRGDSFQPWRLHDIRRSLATGLQRLGAQLQVIESVLGHVSGSRAGIVGVYQRHSFEPEAADALDAWARRLAEIVGLAPEPQPVEPSAVKRIEEVVAAMPEGREKRILSDAIEAVRELERGESNVIPIKRSTG
jgi:integrase